MRKKLTPRRWIAVSTLVLMLVHSAAAAEPAGECPLMAGTHISKKAMNLFLARDVDQVTEVKQGEHVVGSAHTLGQVTVELEPHPLAAIMKVRLVGETCLKNPQNDNPEKSNLESKIDAIKSIVVDAQGMRTEPAEANCQASLKAIPELGQKAPSFLQGLRQGAEKMAGKQTEQRVKALLDNEIDTAIGSAMQRLSQQHWLPREQAMPLIERLSYATTFSHVCFKVLASSVPALPEPRSPRALDTDYDLHVLVHENFFSALGSEWFSGKRIEDRDVLDHVERMRGRAPWGLWVHERRPRWAVTLAEEDSFAMRFDQSQVQVHVRIDRMELGTRTLESPVEVMVTLQPELTDAGPHLSRVAQSQITFLDGDLNAEREEFALMLQQKFDAIFPEAIYFDGLKTPSNGAWSKFISFELQEFAAEQGYFSVAFRLPDQQPVMADRSETEQR